MPAVSALGGEGGLQNKKMPEFQKRKCAILTPYKKSEQGVLIFLQKRTMDAKRAPGKFGFFGGGVENEETYEEALLREIKEELDIVPQNFWFLKEYNFEKKISFAYCQEAGENFEKEIKILEGEYGKWFSEKEIFSVEYYDKEFVSDDKPIIVDFFKKMDS